MPGMFCVILPPPISQDMGLAENLFFFINEIVAVDIFVALFISGIV